MKNLIWFTAFLGWLVTEINGEEYEFGDIIFFPRLTLTKTFTPVYKHFAIYVGPREVIDIGQGDNDIFHGTGAMKELSFECKFAKLEKTRGMWKIDRKDNYLDQLVDHRSRTPERITYRIEEMLRNCPKYHAITSNCEHVVTYVRYGLWFSLQRGTFAHYFLMVQLIEDLVIAGERLRHEGLGQTQTHNQQARQPFLYTWRAMRTHLN